MGKVYAATDLHGCGELWDQMKNFLQEDDKLIFLGDAADRGSDGARIMLELLLDPRVIYLKGNHEWIAFEQDSKSFWFKNGGEATYTQLQELSVEEYKILKDEIKKLETCAEYENKDGLRILLCHAGWDMYDPNYDILQSRSHFEVPWPEDCEYDVLVHGHTPTGYMKYCVHNTYAFGQAKPDKIFCYCDGHKINLDLCSIQTGAAALLDLDTFDVHYFYDKNYKEIKKLL